MTTSGRTTHQFLLCIIVLFSIILCCAVFGTRAFPISVQITVTRARYHNRGTILLSHLMQDICSMPGIKKWNTTSHHPECNRLVECFYRMLELMLRKHAARFGSQWDIYLSGVLCSISVLKCASRVYKRKTFLPSFWN